LGWPSLVLPRPRSLSRSVAAIALTCLVVLSLDFVVTIGLSAFRSSFNGDCGGTPLFVRSLHPSQAVFTARVVFAGRSIGALTRGWQSGFDQPTGAHDRRVGDWAIGVVQERFWGLPSWPRLVLLTNYIYWEAETYFIDGRRADGLLTRMLPIVDAGIGCSRTRPEAAAIVDLRALRQGPPTGTRLIGFVQQPETFAGGFSRPRPPKLAADAKISVTGPTGTRTVMTDEAGVYQVDDLAPGDYTVQLQVPDNPTADSFPHDASSVKVHLENQNPTERSFHLSWDGRIEVHVEDESGKPAGVWVILMNAEGTGVPIGVQEPWEINRDGSYQIRKIPPGRYIVVVNPYGPRKASPYDIQFFPTASSAERALELAQGQQVKEIDFRVRRLTERTVRVRVLWPNGNVVAGARVCVAYEHTKDYEPLKATNCIGDTDEKGTAVVSVYGSTRVRLFAEQFVDNDKKKWWDTFYSPRVEAEADKMPDTVDLVLASPKL